MPNSFSVIHKGFIPGRNQPGCEKQPAMKFTEKHFDNLDELAEAPNVLGILGPDVVMLDTDTREDSQALINVLTKTGLNVPYTVTDKGMHFYFRDPSVNSAHTAVMLTCGVVVDIKLGNKNGLDLIKKNGCFRNNGNLDQDLVELPFFLRPLNDASRCNLPTLANLGKGSRNAKLFEMVGRIKRTGLNYEQCKTTIDLINECVIKSPLPKHEIATLCREEGFNNSISIKEAHTTGGAMSTTKTTDTPIDMMSKVDEDTIFPDNTSDKEIPMNSSAPINNTGVRITNKNNITKASRNQADDESKFNHTEVAEDIVKRFNIKTIEYRPFVYIDGEYRPVSDMEFEQLINTVAPESTQRQRSEVKSKVVLIAPMIDKKENESNRRFINFNNGIFDIETNNLLPHSPEHFVPNRIPHDYVANPVDAEACRTLDNFVWQISGQNQDTVNQIYEMAGLCLYRRNFVRGCYILIGPKANGKSTFLNFLNYCLGDNNTESLKMHQLSERFNTQMIDGKLANLGDDISDAYISDSSTLKSLITSDTMLVDVKNKAPYKMTPYATLIFSANNMPRATDATKALLDRLVIVQFPTQFSAAKGNLNTDMAALLHKPEIAQEFLRRAVIALQTIRATKQLTIGKVSAEMKREYEIENNSVLSFLTDPLGIGEHVDEEINKKPLADLHNKYIEYCRGAGVSPMSRNTFSRFLKNQLNNAVKKTVKLDGKTYNAFTRADELEPITIQF